MKINKTDMYGCTDNNHQFLQVYNIGTKSADEDYKITTIITLQNSILSPLLLSVS